jgi:hypothetical protein
MQSWVSLRRKHPKTSIRAFCGRNRRQQSTDKVTHRDATLTQIYFGAAYWIESLTVGGKARMIAGIMSMSSTVFQASVLNGAGTSPSCPPCWAKTKGITRKPSLRMASSCIARSISFLITPLSTKSAEMKKTAAAHPSNALSTLLTSASPATMSSLSNHVFKFNSRKALSIFPTKGLFVPLWLRNIHEFSTNCLLLSAHFWMSMAISAPVFCLIAFASSV